MADFWLHRVDRFWLAAMIAVVSYIIVLSAYSIGYSENHVIDAGVFVHAGDALCRDCSDIYVFRNSTGYDGMFYFAMAKAPFDLHRLDDMASPEQRSYRYQRILYPLLVYFFSFGLPAVVPYSMLLVNLFSLAGSILIYGRILSLNGKPPTFLCYVPLAAGLFVSVLLDLAEPLWVVLVLAGFYFLKSNNHLLSAVSFGLALFSRESGLYVLIPLLFFYSFQRQFKVVALYFVPVGVFILWQFCLYGVFHYVPLLSYHPPLRDLGINALLVSASTSHLSDLPVFLIQGSVLVALVVSAIAWRKRKTLITTTFVMNSVLAFILLLFYLPWSDIFAASRTILPLTVIALMCLAESRDNNAIYALLPQVTVTVLLAVFYLLKAVMIL
jgi:hypothetical protein